MSLTSFLTDYPDVRKRFRREFNKPKFLAIREMVCPPLTPSHSQVGIAFHYMVGFLVQRLNKNTIDLGWVPELALNLLNRDDELFARGKRFVLEAKSAAADYIRTGKVSESLLVSCLCLATLDPIYRSGFGHDYIGEIGWGSVRDLRNLFTGINENDFIAKKLSILSPTFGRGSELVGGADADLILDSTLIDIKTTRTLSLQRRYFDQLLGYYAIHCIGGVDGVRPKPRLHKLAIYFARHRYLYVMRISDIVNRDKFPKFVAWFERRASQAFRNTS